MVLLIKDVVHKKSTQSEVNQLYEEKIVKTIILKNFVGFTPVSLAVVKEDSPIKNNILSGDASPDLRVLV